MGQKNFIAIALGTAAFMLSSPILADTRAGVDAWTRGDFSAAVRAWEIEAAKGDADALFNLGQAYKLGNGVKQDLARAEALFRQAGVLGHLQASDNYGLLLFQRGERTQALPFIRAAADRGDPRAQYLLGIAHFNGDIVPKDWVRAYALVSLAQQAGLAQAADALSQMDQHVPMPQRQQAVELAAELRSDADATRARQFAAVDLGATVSAGPTTVATLAMRNASPTTTGEGASPATAGADYARPVAARPLIASQDLAPRAAVAAVPSAAMRTSPPPAPGPKPAAAPVGSWRIQLGAFGQPANADALWYRLKGHPALAGKPRVPVKAGAVTKLQAGGFASEAAARSACERLSSAGQTCIVVKG